MPRRAGLLFVENHRIPAIWMIGASSSEAVLDAFRGRMALSGIAQSADSIEEMSQAQRRTKYDRVLTVLEEIIPIWRDCTHKTSSATADWLSEILEAIGPNGYVLKKARKSEIAAAQLQFLGDFLHPGNHRGDERDRALNKARRVFHREFPEYIEKLASKRDKIIARGTIKTEDEYHLIRDYIDDVEGQPDSVGLLDQLYKLVDDFGVDTD